MSDRRKQIENVVNEIIRELTSTKSTRLTAKECMIRIAEWADANPDISRFVLLFQKNFERQAVMNTQKEIDRLRKQKHVLIQALKTIKWKSRFEHGLDDCKADRNIIENALEKAEELEDTK